MESIIETIVHAWNEIQYDFKWSITRGMIIEWNILTFYTGLWIFQLYSIRIICTKLSYILKRAKGSNEDE